MNHGMFQNEANFSSYPDKLINNKTAISLNISPESFAVLDYINIVLIPACLITGVPGNIITIILMNTNTFSHFASKYFLIALAIADISVLCTQPFKNMSVIRYLGFDLRTFSAVGCKFYFWIHKTGKMASSWFVVCVALERLVAVKLPFKVKYWFSKQYTLVTIMIVTGIIGGFNVGYAYYTEIDENGICNPDVYDKNSSHAITVYHHMLNVGVSLYFIGPLLVLFVVTPVIIISLIITKHKQSKLFIFNGRNIVVKPTTMLISVMIAYIVFVTPLGIVRIIVNYYGFNLYSVNSTTFSIFRDISFILELMNYSSNFFLYVCSSKPFRDGVASLCVRNCIHRI